jgi:MFS family permease
MASYTLALTTAEPSTRPTRVRYRILALLCALSLVLFVDRICIAKAARDIETELHISHAGMGLVFGAFTLAYGLFEVPAGRWGDRRGPRRVLLRIVLWWSVFTALTGCIWPFCLDAGLQLRLPGLGTEVPLLFDSFFLLLLVRFLFGVGEAGAIPNTACVVAAWFPRQGRGPAQALLGTSMMLSGAATPVLVAYLLPLLGWHVSFALFGSLGVAWSIAFYLWFRDRPSEHPAVNEAECRLIADGAAPAPVPGSVPWGRVLTSPNLWLLGAVNVANAFLASLCWFWFPTYLQDARQVDDVQAGWLSGLMLVCAAGGSLLGGFLGEVVIRGVGSRRWGRSLFGVCGMGGAALLLLAVPHCDSPLGASLCTGLALLGCSAMMTTWWSVVTENSGRHVGAVFGLANSLALPGAVAGPLFLGWFVESSAGWGY